MGVFCMKRILEEKNVENLFHFTQACNLPNILTYGLLSKRDLENKDITFELNDQYRYDGFEDAVCMSIEFPNYKMFYSIRMQKPEETKWVVLMLDASILCDLDCAFCVDNAADSKSTSISISERKGREALLKLFEEYPGKSSRSDLKLLDHWPTNPQAEVLVFDDIPVSYVKAVFFADYETLQKYRKNIVSCEVEASVYNYVFSYRKDWAEWR